jgi:MFS transporter, FSR family, fosmidomycin resistance protein
MNAGPRNRRLLFVISYHHACNDGALIALVALLPILVEEMSLTYTEIGLLGLGLLITVVVQMVIGRMTDRSFSRYLLEIGAALMAVSFVLLLFVSDFVGLFAAVIFMRVGASFYHPVGISWITREYAGSYLDTALGIQSGIGNFGVIASLATSGFLGEAFGWKVPCVVWAVLNLAAVAFGLVLTRDSAPQEPRRSGRQSVTAGETVSKIAYLAVPVAAGGALYSVTTYYGPVNLTTMHGWGAGEADLIFAVWLGVGTVSSYFYGAIRARFERSTIVSAGYAVSILALLGLFVTSEWYLVVPILIVYGALMFLTYPAIFAIVSERTGAEERGTAFGVVFAAQLGGAATMTYACGVVADHLGDPSYAYPLTALFALSALVLFAASHRRGKGL